jgi:hypothetical protein
VKVDALGFDDRLRGRSRGREQHEWV